MVLRVGTDTNLGRLTGELLQIEERSMRELVALVDPRPVYVAQSSGMEGVNDCSRLKITHLATGPARSKKRDE